MARTRGPGSRRDLLGRVVAVTGAARGIGEAIAATLAAAGADVVLGDLDVGAVTATAARIAAASGSTVTGVRLDVADRPSFQAFLAGAQARFGPLDVLINNAGIMWVGPFDDEPEAMARRQFDVNVLGVRNGFTLAAPVMRARGGGQIVTIASAASRLAPAGEATYAATKHAVLGYATAVREELRGSGVEVSLVLPAVVDTELAVGTATGATPRLSTQHVADAVLRVVRRPRFETYVPARAGWVHRLEAVLPRAGADRLHRLVVPNQVKAVAGREVRTHYEQRLRAVPDDPGPER